MSSKRPFSSSGINALSTTRRVKGNRFIDPITVLAALEEQTENPAQALEWVKKVLQTAIDMQPQLPPEESVRKVISSSTIDMADVRYLLGVYYSELDLECEWKVDETETTAMMGTTWADSAINEIRAETDWGIDTCEALARTIVTLLIFDRKKHLSPVCRFQSLRIVGEYPISTHTFDDHTIVSGRCDLVLGYGGHPRKNDLDFGLVAVEIKRRYTLPTTVSAQLVAYLVGLHQRRRAANQTVEHVFGIATDGMNYIFHRLDRQLHLRTATITAAHSTHICRYIDVILESAVLSSPHTSPATKFPGTAKQYHSGVEKNLCLNGIPITGMIVEAKKSDYVLRIGEDGQPVFCEVGSEFGSDSDRDSEDMEDKEDTIEG